MAKKETRPYAYICLWEYVPPPEKRKDDIGKKRWKLIECYGVDDCGYACTESKHASGDRHSYDKWSTCRVWWDEKNEKILYSPPEGVVVGDDDEDDEDRDCRPGTAVTIWSFEGGTHLAVFNPPNRVPWLNPMFSDELKKLKNWYTFLEDGYTLYAGTARAVERMLWPKKQPQTDI
jgi:hypothetical protein